MELKFVHVKTDRRVERRPVLRSRVQLTAPLVISVHEVAEGARITARPYEVVAYGRRLMPLHCVLVEQQNRLYEVPL